MDMVTERDTDNSRSKSPAIGEALELLRTELGLLQDQDVLLLKQLMNVHYSIRMLKRKLSRRTNSFSNLAPFSPISAISNASMTLPSHASLSRVMSEPSNKSLIYQRSVSVAEEDEEDDDELAESFNSGESDETDPLKFSLNVDPEVSALLTDMPKSLRRKYLASLNQNMYTMVTPSGRNKQQTPQQFRTVKQSGETTKCMQSETKKPLQHNNFTTKRKLSSKRSNKMAVPNGLCSEHLNEDLAYESDSSGGIEITAL